MIKLSNKFQLTNHFYFGEIVFNITVWVVIYGEALINVLFLHWKVDNQCVLVNMQFNYNIFSKKQECFCILMFWNWRNIKINFCLVKCPGLVSFVSSLRPWILLVNFSWFNVSLLWFNFYNSNICENNAYTVVCLI